MEARRRAQRYWTCGGCNVGDEFLLLHDIREREEDNQLQHCEGDSAVFQWVPERGASEVHGRRESEERPRYPFQSLQVFVCALHVWPRPCAEGGNALQE